MRKMTRRLMDGSSPVSISSRMGKMFGDGIHTYRMVYVDADAARILLWPQSTIGARVSSRIREAQVRVEWTKSHVGGCVFCKNSGSPMFSRLKGAYTFCAPVWDSQVGIRLAAAASNLKKMESRESCISIFKRTYLIVLIIILIDDAVDNDLYD